MTLVKIWLVTKHEYIYNFQRKSFLFTAFVLPILMGAGFYLVGSLVADSETNLDDFSNIGYVDHAGILADADELHDEFERYTQHPSEEDARATFDAGEIDGYFVIGEDYLELGQIQFYGEKGVPEALDEEFGNFLVRAMVQNLPDAANPDRLQHVSDVKIQLVGEDEPSEEETLVARFVLPLIFALVMLMSVLTTSQFLMSSVVEEKENRIMEILMISIRPVELIIGKFLGLGALALTQISVWAMTAAFIANATGQLDVLRDVRLEPMEIVVMALYFLLTFGLYAGIMIAIGSSVSAEQESRQVAAVFTLIFVSPSWAIGAFFEAPTGPIATAFGLFPMTSGLSNLVLIGLGETRTWQVVLSLGLLFATTVLMLLAAAKIFRAGALLYGQRLSFRQLRRALRG